MSGRVSVRAAFRTRAVIDWIELAVTLQSGTQFRYVRTALCSILGPATRPYVEAVNAGAGGVATRFILRLYDAHAATFRELERITGALALAHPFAKPPEVTGIELALDFYSRGDLNAVSDMVHRLQSSIEANGKNPRQFDPDKAPKPKHGNRFLNRDRPEPVTGLTLDPRLNLRIGNAGDAVQWQIYDKRTDNNRQPIEPSQRRARAEFTLTGKELAKRVLGPDAGSRLANLADLQTFKFETLACFLHFREFKPVETITPAPVLASTLPKIKALHEHGIMNYHLGSVATYRDKRRSTDVGRRVSLKHSRHTVADPELNDIARRTLKALTRRFA
jgi:hypothetical protein